MSNGQFQRNLSFFKVSEGVQHFPVGRGPTFSRGGGGSNCLFPIDTHITCDFPGGSGPPVPPLDSHLTSQITRKNINLPYSLFVKYVRPVPGAHFNILFG